MGKSFLNLLAVINRLLIGIINRSILQMFILADILFDLSCEINIG